MDEEPGAADAPFGDAIETGPRPKQAPPTSRAIAMFAIVFLVLALIAAVTWSIGTSPPESRFCTAEGRIDPVTGQTFGRDPSQDCTFVDADGDVLPGQ